MISDLDFICCIKKLMRQPRQLVLPGEPCREPRVLRRLSLRQQHACEWDDLLEQEGLRTIGEYIQSNIRSKRKNIMQLYSTTISFLEHSENLTYTELCPSPSPHKKIKKRSALNLLQPLPSPQPPKNTLLHQDSEECMIVSNKFPQKLHKLKPPPDKPCPKTFETKLPYHSPPAKVSISPSPTKKQSKSKYQLPQVMRNINVRSPRKNRVQPPTTPNQINPWEYLVIPEDPYYFNV